jgi:DNA (cytosine-5)-methyltransferase 1
MPASREAVSSAAQLLHDRLPEGHLRASREALRQLVSIGFTPFAMLWKPDTLAREIPCRGLNGGLPAAMGAAGDHPEVSAYYDEHDPYAAQWLRNLIAAGHIAPGDVDERSIVDVRADDLRGYTQCHFFAGIGGWSVALRLAGWDDERPVWTGSCPCQPFSAAGAGKAGDDERHLWPAWASLIRECRPRTVFGEQVEAAIGWGWLDLVFADLEAQGYACASAVLPACGVGAPHIRQRVWFVAQGLDDADSGERLRSEQGARGRDIAQLGRPPRGVADASHERHERNGSSRRRGDGPAHDSAARGVADADTARRRQFGRSGLLDGERSAFGDYTDRCGDAGGLEHTESIGLLRRQDDLNERRRERSPGQGSASSGVWSDAEWLPCSDGKARQVKSSAQCMADGLSGAMGLMRSNRSAAKEIADAAQSIGFADQALSALRDGYEPHEVWRSLGGCLGFSEAAVLLACMCEHSWQLGQFFRGETSSSIQSNQAALREMQWHAPTAARPSFGWRLSEQFTGQLANAMSLLPQARALASFNGFPLSHGILKRPSKLRAYGNAIVPQVAAEFVQAFLEAAP